MLANKIKNTADVVEFNRTLYVGVMPVRIIALNPTEEEYKEIYGVAPTKELSYIGTTEYTDPVSQQVSTVKTARLDFIIKNEEEDFLSKVTFFLQDTPFKSKAGKAQVIDKYGRTAWVTSEEFAAKQVPQYANGPARLDSDYRLAYRNEEELLKFIKYYIGIPNVDNYVDGNWVNIDNPEEAEVAITTIKNFFDGDFKELKELVKLANVNKIKVLLGVRMVDGNEYQDVFTREFMRNASTSTKQLSKAVKETQEGGGYSNTIFEVCKYKKFEGAETKETVNNVADNPFASPEVSSETAPF